MCQTATKIRFDDTVANVVYWPRLQYPPPYLFYQCSWFGPVQNIYDYRCTAYDELYSHIPWNVIVIDPKIKVDGIRGVPMWIRIPHTRRRRRRKTTARDNNNCMHVHSDDCTLRHGIENSTECVVGPPIHFADETMATLFIYKDNENRH